jgi:hypothetical protein
MQVNNIYKCNSNDKLFFLSDKQRYVAKRRRLNVLHFNLFNSKTKFFFNAKP